ncbi:auxin efflux carrier [Nadsonia fulvescens var. elongata DSM 6958]|uniref:Auxin efflux carrier n=1 Tax=Nadsonia fulvescens var. elongata DSM 6958 TaxID=857566 RepID=A0A1E3PKA3_9ASCO|nr:auxin efflux carrier [Nadsonia fulvescens var. elongata DSM 6958]
MSSSTSLSIGAAIYIAVKPIIKIFLNASLGYMLAKHNLFTVEFCKNMSIIIINYFTPCLVFSRVVSTIDSSDLKTIGVVILMAVLYQFFGLVVGLVLNHTTPVPRAWRGGMLIMGIFNNAADLPVAYVTTLANGSQFSANDGAKGTSYAMVFTLVFVITMFSFGAFQLIERDFEGQLNPQDDEKIIEGDVNTKENADLPIPNDINLVSSTVISNPKAVAPSTGFDVDSVHSFLDSQYSGDLSPVRSFDSEVLPHSKNQGQNTSSGSVLRPCTITATATSAGTIGLRRSLSRRKHAKEKSDIGDSEYDGFYNNEDLLDETIDDVIDTYSRAPALKRNDIQQQDVSSMPLSTRISVRPFYPRLLRILKRVLINCLRPPSSSLIISIIICMVKPLRSLFFLDAANTTFHRAPDGQPVLHFLMDFTMFVGNATVPCGLCMLGATMARLKIGTLPQGFWKSVLVMTVAKLVVLPIIAVALVTQLIKAGWIAADNYMAIFVLVITAGTPGATSQIYITATYTSPDDPEHLALDCCSAMLVAQYVVLFLSLSVLVTYTLKCVVNF